MIEDQIDNNGDKLCLIPNMINALLTITRLRESAFKETISEKIGDALGFETSRSRKYIGKNHVPEDVDRCR